MQTEYGKIGLNVRSNYLKFNFVVACDDLEVKFTVHCDKQVFRKILWYFLVFTV